MTTISLFVSFVLTICCCLSCIKTHVVNDICNIAYESDGNTYIIISDSVEETEKLLENNFSISNPVIIDAALPQNEWYVKWLNTDELPVTCLFSSKCELLKIEYGIQGIPENENTVAELNQIFQNQRYIELGADMGEEVDFSMLTMPYPYVYYQNLLCSILANDKVRMEMAAYAFLDFENVGRYADSYRDEFRIAHSILDQNVAGPEIHTEIDSDTKYRLKLSITNAGNDNLIISRIGISCPCLTKNFESDFMTIAPGKEKRLQFDIINEDSATDINKEILIFSNAVNYPVLKLDVLND